MVATEKPIAPAVPQTAVKMVGQIGKSDKKPTWCPGCGDYGVLAAVEKAAKTLGIASHDLYIVSGIGCSSNFPHFLNSYGFHSIHGRAVAVANGVKMANHNLKVVVTGGDGDGYGIGCGHLVHTMRRNLDITYIVMDNEIYGLTTGQASPTSMMGAKTKSTPEGVIEEPLNPIAVAIAAGATYVARGFSGDVKHLTDLVTGALKHKGFALVDVQSPCITYNRFNTFEYFRQRVYKLEDQGYDPHDKIKAFEKAQEWGDKIPIGLFYQTQRPIYEELDNVLKAGPLVYQKAGIKGRMDILEEFI
jgi:2-oxoglutarate ferredoxin oxidoreductase subunit beta